jgi:putative transposase
MTKVLVRGVGWVDIVGVLGWYTQTVVGPHAGLPCPARHGLAALDTAVNRQVPHGARDPGVCLMRENGCQPPSTTCIRACRRLGIQQALTSYGNPIGHADTARLIRPRKEACLWLREWTCPFQLMRACIDWIDHYHAHDLHAALGDKSPIAVFTWMYGTGDGEAPVHRGKPR